jgi:mannose-6-phosphate isomerase-like protein (cupin superfamily)
MVRFDPAKHIVRFAQLKPRASVMRDRDPGILVEFFQETETTLRNFTYMTPRMANNSHISATAAIEGGDAGDALLVSVAICFADTGPPMHNLLRTTESFFVLKGELHVTIGENEEEKYVLQPWDFITVPPGVMRRFKGGPNGETALLAIIQGNKNEPPRELRRLQRLRRWSHDKVKQVLTRGPRARRAHGAGAPRRLPLAVVSH